MLTIRTATRLAWLLCLVVPLAQAQPEAGVPDEAELDPVEVNAARESELLARVVMLGLQRRPSHRAEDALKVVCEKSARLGTNVKTIRCATNATWLNIGQASKNANAEALAEISGGYTDNNMVGLTRLAPLLARAAGNSPYSSRQYDGVREGRVLEFGSAIQRLRSRYPGDAEEQDRRLKRLFAEDEVAANLAPLGLRLEPKRVVAFAAAHMALAAEPGAAAERRASVLAAEGLSGEDYDAFTRRLQDDARFESLVARARDALLTPF